MLTRLSIIILILLCLFAAISVAGIIEIPKDAETIQIGIAMAVDNDTLLVEPGTYVENIDFSGKNILILAFGGPDITTLMPSDPYDHTVAFIHNEQSAGLIGFSITGGLTAHTLFIDSGASPLIEGNVFHTNLAYDVYDKAVIACWSDSSLPVICRNIFYDNLGMTTIWIQKGKGDIINNTIVGNNSALMCNTGLTVVYNNIIAYCTYLAVDGTYADFDYTNMFENNGDFG